MNTAFSPYARTWKLVNERICQTVTETQRWIWLMKFFVPESTGWDATVWLTRAQLGGPSGFAPVDGVCSKTRSAAIDRDEGLTSAFVIAHELAHLWVFFFYRALNINTIKINSWWRLGIKCSQVDLHCISDHICFTPVIHYLAKYEYFWLSIKCLRFLTLIRTYFKLMLYFSSLKICRDALFYRDIFNFRRYKILVSKSVSKIRCTYLNT